MIRSIILMVLGWLRLVRKPQLLARLAQKFPSGEELPTGRLVVVQGGGKDKWGCLRCPGGCGERIDLNLVASRSPRWQVRVDWFQRPSVHPSVRQLEGCRCHFWIKEGSIQWCEDSGHRCRPADRQRVI